MEPFFTFCTCTHEAMLWHATCTKIWMPVTFNTGLFYKRVFYGENRDFLIFESLLKMSPHGRHNIAYTSRIYTMQYAYHICNGIGPTVISISLFWTFLLKVSPLLQTFFFQLFYHSLSLMTDFFQKFKRNYFLQNLPLGWL